MGNTTVENRFNVKQRFEALEDKAKAEKAIATGVCTVFSAPSGLLAAFAIYSLGAPVQMCVMMGFLLTGMAFITPFILPTETEPKSCYSSITKEQLDAWHKTKCETINEEVAAMEAVSGKHVKRWPTDWFDAYPVFWEDAVEAARNNAGMAVACAVMLLLLDAVFIAILVA